jgi:AraC-like DNA-binding protein/mannose-6-phosphate isomerase-like protein (cupin superfamily)
MAAGGDRMTVSFVGFSPFSMPSFAAHSHDDWEIVLNLEGEGTTVIGGREYAFCPGTIICQPPGMPHAKQARGQFRDIFIRMTDPAMPFPDGVSIFQDDEEKSFETLMLMALRIFHKKEANYLPVVNAIYVTLRNLLLSWLDKEPQNPAVESFKNVLIDHLMDPEFSVMAAMKKTAYCTDHFRRCFKKSTGTTPNAYLSDLRIEYARNLILQNRRRAQTIAEIAFASGFSDPRYFSRVFRAKTGCSPLEYQLNPIGAIGAVKG